MRSSFRRRLLAVVLAILSMVLASSPLTAFGGAGVQFQFDLSTSGRVIGNKWSSVDAWAYQEDWTGTTKREPTYFSTHYPSINYVQIMSATGGCYVGYPSCSNITRDLFLNPADETTVTDYN